MKLYAHSDASCQGDRHPDAQCKTNRMDITAAKGEQNCSTISMARIQ